MLICVIKSPSFSCRASRKLSKNIVRHKFQLPSFTQLIKNYFVAAGVLNQRLFLQRISAEEFVSMRKFPSWWLKYYESRRFLFIPQHDENRRGKDLLLLGLNGEKIHFVSRNSCHGLFIMLNEAPACSCSWWSVFQQKQQVIRINHIEL